MFIKLTLGIDTCSKNPDDSKDGMKVVLNSRAVDYFAEELEGSGSIVWFSDSHMHVKESLEEIYTELDAIAKAMPQ